MTPIPLIDAGLVRRLVRAQFPLWGDLDIVPVEPGGWDNRTFRLGANMLARLPSREAYAQQVIKEQTWLPRLAPHLPLRIPRPLALGQPADDYPWPWSVYEWLEGEPVETALAVDKSTLAVDLAAFLSALQKIDAGDGPPPSAHNHFRGASLHAYDSQARQALVLLADQIDATAAGIIWSAALASAWTRAPVWLHGDVSPGNLLIRDGRISAVIDFGLVGVGDPACDLAFAWTYLDALSRDLFHKSLAIDSDTWMRGKAWALWKALIVCAGLAGATPPHVANAWRTISEVLAD